MSSHVEVRWILLFLRVVLAAVMLHYGTPKIRDLRSNACDFVQMGFKPGMFWGTLIAVVEFVGGLAMLLGLWAELAAALFGFQMIVGTLWKLKIRKEFADYSYDIQLFALCLVIMAEGAGAYALATFPSTFFLRWDVALAALVGAVLLAVFSKPDQRSDRAPE